MSVVFTDHAVEKMRSFEADPSAVGKLLAEIQRLSEQSELWAARKDPNIRGNSRAVVARSGDMTAILTEDNTDPDRVIVATVWRGSDDAMLQSRGVVGEEKNTSRGE